MALPPGSDNPFKSLATTEPKAEPWDLPSYAWNFVANPVYSTANVFADLPGVGPLFEPIRDWSGFDRVEDFKTENPVGAAAGEFASWFIPGSAWVKATRGVKELAAISKLAGGGLPGYLATETARWAPFTAANVGILGAAGRYDSPVQAAEDFAFQTGLGLAANTGLGVLFPKLLKSYDVPLSGIHEGAAGRLNLREKVADFDTYEPFQLQLRKLHAEAAKQELPEDTRIALQGAISERRRGVLGEEARGLTGYTSFPRDQRTGSFFENAFRVNPDRKAKGSFTSHKLTMNEPVMRGWTYDRIKEAAELPDDFEQWMRYPRFLAPKTPSGEKYLLQQRIPREMSSIGDGFWMAQEPENGMWIMAKRLAPDTERKERLAKVLLWKTDAPEQFAPKNERWNEVFSTRVKERPIGALAWDDIERSTAPGGWLFEQSRKLAKMLPLEDYQALLRAGDKGTFNQLLDEIGKRGGDATVALKDFTRRNLSPTLNQFGSNPRANRAWTLARTVKDEALEKARSIVFGSGKVDPSFAARNVPYASRAGLVGAIEEAEKVDPNVVRKLWEAYQADKPPDPVKEPALAKLWKTLGATSVENIADTNKTLKVTGQRLIPVREGHPGFSRGWLRGNTHFAIRNADDKLVAISAGTGNRGALRDAEKVIEEYARRGRAGLHVAERFTKGSSYRQREDIAEIAKLTRGFMEERGGIGGYDFDLEPWTKQELIGLLDKGYRARATLEAQATYQHLLADDLARLQVEDPKIAGDLGRRLSLLEGKEGEFSQAQNKAADVILEPLLGPDAASKITAATNRLMIPLNLGAGLVSYPVANLASIFQTIPGELAFVAHAMPEAIARDYTFMPVFGANGKPQGAVGRLSEWAMMRNTLDLLFNPTPEFKAFLERAANDGTLNPRFIEEWTGQTGRRVGDFGSAFSSGKDFLLWLEAISNFPATETEKWLRHVAMASGYSAFTRYRPRTDPEALYQSVKTFVDRVAYRYAREDRPLLFTTPAGMLLGGFKNWMMNYLFTMGRYVGEAGRGNLAPLLWQTAATGAVGGLAATPFIGGAADSLAKLFGDDDGGLMEYLYSNMDENVADGIMFGLPTAILGWTISPQVSAPGSHFAHDTEMFFSIAALERAKNMARATGSAWDAWRTTGANPLDDPKVMTQIWQGFAPRSMYKAYQALQEGSMRAPSTGYPSIDPGGAWSRIGVGLGFSTGQIERQYEVYDKMMRDKEFRKAAVSRFGEAYANAMLEGDQDMMEELLIRAAVQGVDQSSMLRSAQARVRLATKDMFERRFNEEELAGIQVPLAR